MYTSMLQGKKELMCYSQATTLNIVHISLNPFAAFRSFTVIYVRTCKSTVKVTWKQSASRHVRL